MSGRLTDMGQQRGRRTCFPRCLRDLALACAVVLAVCFPETTRAEKQKKKSAPPVSLEASLHANLSSKVEDALLAAANHLAVTLGGTDGSTPFWRYEFDLGHVAKSEERWRMTCEEDIDAERDTVHLCALHKLEALCALCEAFAVLKDDPAKDHKIRTEGVSNLIRHLLHVPGEVVKGLGMRRMSRQGRDEVWVIETAKGSGNYSFEYSLHSTVMLAVASCQKVVAPGDKEYMHWLDMWYRALPPRQSWEQHRVTHNAAVWESLVLTSAAITSGSAFAEDLQDFIEELENYLRRGLARGEKSDEDWWWSYSSAHASSVRLANAKKASSRKEITKDVSIYIERFMKEIGPKLRVAKVYTCGPLQGLASMLSPEVLKQKITKKAGISTYDFVRLVLALMEKDVARFQLGPKSPGEKRWMLDADAGKQLENISVEDHALELNGAFLRDPGQLENERRRSIRIDDTAQCVKALARVLRSLRELLVVDNTASDSKTIDASSMSSALAILMPEAPTGHGGMSGEL